MSEGDPLRVIEMIALLEEATTPLRHDVRNRIASIRNLSYFVRRKLAAEVAPERDPRLNEFLSKIESEVQRTDDVIEAWGATVHARRPPAPRTANAAECARLAIDSARLPAQVAIELSQSAGALEIHGDIETLAFALRCLIENAGEAIGSGTVGVALEREANLCRMTVTDPGPGIADPVRCFERFASTKRGHLGLGLCMARRIASRAGGDVLIGKPERGAQVSLLVPIFGSRPPVALGS